MARHDNGTINEKLLRSVGNGHIATNVFGDTVFVDGVYNGRLGESHRARLRARHASDFEVVGCTGQQEERLYILNMESGK